MYSLDVYTSPYVMMSSDFSQQEPKLVAYVSGDKNLIKAFQEGKDVYSTIASIAFHKPYEECLEFHPVTKEYQPEGKARRSQSKLIVLGICYGRSVPSIGQQLYGHDDTMSDEEKSKEAQRVYDAVMRAFPALERLMHQSQAFAKKHGYVETILGRRRHLPDMMLNEFEFEPLPGYVNPNIDPLDPTTVSEDTGIPQSTVDMLRSEFSKYKYFGQIARRTKELYEKDSIRVVNNRPKINDARRQCVNCVDSETEILTVNGWKRYDEISIGDEILSYCMDSGKIVRDSILEIHTQHHETPDIEVIHLSNSAFDAVCTADHRWVMRNFDTANVRIYDTNHILRFHRPRYHILRIAKNDLNLNNTQVKIEEWKTAFYANEITVSDIFKLSQNNALSIYNWFRDNIAKSGCITFDTEEQADKFQILSLLAGRVSNKRIQVIPHKKKADTIKYKVACSKKVLYETARIDLMTKQKSVTDFVWCVTTTQGTWIARRSGKYYITGNSIIQGSAADFTKTALLNVYNDPEWKSLGGEILTVVHDEIIAQVPIENWELGAQILKRDMESAGSFLPFPIKCDVTATYRWYGLELPCSFKKPTTMKYAIRGDDPSELSVNDISWVQWHLVELGYELPVYRDSEGNKPRGDAAHGVSGVWSQEYQDAVFDYCNSYDIPIESFLDHIECKAVFGIVER